eukprot:scaffold84901_cov15-Tisochrysis_lutea.AAC.1
MGLDLFHAQGEASSLPVTVQANIEEGRLYFFGKELPLPIKGKGLFTILYIDDKVRIFRSGKSYAVQVRCSALWQNKNVGKLSQEN